ncbi:MAG: S8 family serine peptidase, partial [Synechococcus sp. SB0675_bin_7]|nr:S8 family serine peptidase [Synechococcus sp. SB0675_bin_7]
MEKTILVWGAGNDGQRGTIAKPSSPAILAGLVARIGEVRGHSIAVVSVGEAGTISSFSNRCGIAQDFCLAAPGQSVLVANNCQPNPNSITTTACSQKQLDTGYRAGSGTSYAAPMVSGGL